MLLNYKSRGRDVCVERAGVVVDRDLVKAGLSARAYSFGLCVERLALYGREIDDLRGLRHGRRLLEVRRDGKREVRHYEKYSAHYLTERVLVLVTDLEGALRVSRLGGEDLYARELRGVDIVAENFLCFFQIAHFDHLSNFANGIMCKKRDFICYRSRPLSLR